MHDFIYTKNIILKKGCVVMTQMLTALIICIAIYAIAYKLMGRKAKGKYVLVQRKFGFSGPNKEREYSSLYFGKEIYSKINPNLMDENNVFVPLNRCGLYINRRLFKNVYPTGKVTYDYNGYEPLKDSEIKKAFKMVEECYQNYLNSNISLPIKS